MAGVLDPDTLDSLDARINSVPDFSQRPLPATPPEIQRPKVKETKSHITVDNIFLAANVDRIKDAFLRSSKHTKRYPGSSDKTPKQAAVLVPFCLISGEPAVIFILRPGDLSNHGAEVCFPGGMVQSSDTDRAHTAIRETVEEIGLDGNQISVWGQLPPIPGHNWQTFITPVVGYCGKVNLPTLRVNHKEVADLFSITVESLCNPVNLKYTRFRGTTTGSYTLPAFLGGRYRVWGLTGMMLHLSLLHVAPGMYSFRKVDFLKRQSW
ncbi:hypothetical protein LSH36_486g04020 [Paralvinella palmiformis]|uniref:Nudix hydrolase domain-containing protein n=1 Tax=Paralvinella palmiformis TaxID=53620 RepID=A0AAD9J9F9_9ANNE|nr:hypothetical protein LSH36_486g04020 [Paralvinella palmiformis]